MVPDYNGKVNKDELAALLHDLPLGELRWYESIPSTNACALEWLREFPKEYSLVATNHQTAGYGRNQRPWHSTASASLTFSFILYPNQSEQGAVPLFSALAALSICDAVASFSPSAKIAIKWPNDVLLDGKKGAGILAEAAWQGRSLMGLVMGIGVNVRPAFLSSATQELLFPATSLEECIGKLVERWELLHRIMAAFIARRDNFQAHAFMNAWREKLAFLGEEVTLSRTGKELQHGTFLDVNEQGYLLLKEENGRISTFPLGDVSLRPRLS